VATLTAIAPFLVVDNLQASLDFYCSKLGFEITYTGGGDGNSEDFYGMVQRDGVMIADTGDSLRAFEIIDKSGYVICFGRPQDAKEA
jgi:catechol 2,3-dioxygenase-like lactoylglutathione lyase family enzyme